ncbi:uncharacterized protein BX663DRAFT_435084 [Cokeromyces recurvatus]|uniref:uncharacterized protein n=1 Tax=Cokeromyces recurvatus TaxID=90255 RepID=UPI00221FDAF4|nr:uncharacterized protein BX663DRAFT_435084 [Cokeromyces recurvatus]KAI7902563.1 hypothetical protein BX663DRAFT_435084 [Cokeromyces recurvatus]
MKHLESCQNSCIRRTFDEFSRTLVTLILQLVNQSTMAGRALLLQDQFLFCINKSPTY